MAEAQQQQSQSRQPPPRVLMVKMLKTYGCNTTGDICAFSAAVAEELVRKGAAEMLGPIDLETQTWDVVQGKAVPKRPN